MILLELGNRIVFETLLERFTAEKRTSLELVCADFDGTEFHMFTPEGNRDEIHVSIAIKCANELQAVGVQQRMQNLYGRFLTNPESGYNFTLVFNLDNLPDDKERLARAVSMMKSNIYGTPFHHVFQATESGNLNLGLIDIPIRSRDERLFLIQNGNDRVTVIFSILFKDPDDVIFGKVFLNEFKKSIGGAPSVEFSHRDPPAELAQARDVPTADNVGFVSFVLFERHFKGEKKHRTIGIMQTFRNYLHYHIKCAKSHLHTRMRNRVNSFLTVLNRAKQDLPRQRVTATGRTFKAAPAKKRPF